MNNLSRMSLLRGSTKLRRAASFIEMAIMVAITVAIAAIVYLALTDYVQGIFDNLGGWVPGVG